MSPAATTGVRLRLPSMLAELADGSRTLQLATAPATLGGLLDELAASHPALERRIRDEQGQLRRFVNVYVDGVDIRHTAGQQTVLADGVEVHVLPSVAGG